MPAAMAIRQPSIVGRRPTLSATPPSSSEPAAMPNSSMESTQPSVALSMPQSRAMPGDAKLIDRTSKPSRAFSPTVTSTASHWALPMAPSSMMDFGSRPVMFPRCAPEQLLFVNAGEQLDQLGHFFLGEARFEPVLVLLDGTLGGGERLAPAIGEVEGLLAAIAAGFPAHQVILCLEPVHDRHRGSAVHAHALRDSGLGDVRVVIDQPQRRHLLLREVEVGERLGEVPIDRAVSQPDVKADDIADLADVLITGNVRRGDRDRLFRMFRHRPAPELLVIITYKTPRQTQVPGAAEKISPPRRARSRSPASSRFTRKASAISMTTMAGATQLMASIAAARLPPLASAIMPTTNGPMPMPNSV